MNHFRGAICYVTVGNDKLGDIVKCPADPAPTKNPDGSAAESISDGLIKSWCEGAGSDLPIAWANQVGCLIYGYYEALHSALLVPTSEVERGRGGRNSCSLFRNRWTAGRNSLIEANQNVLLTLYDVFSVQQASDATAE